MSGDPDAGELETRALSLARSYLESHDWSGWTVTAGTSAAEMPTGGLRLRFEHPLSLGLDILLLPEQLQIMGTVVAETIGSTEEFELVRAGSAIRPSTASLVRGLRAALWAPDVSTVLERVAWCLVDQGVLEEEEATWFAQAIAESTVPPH